MSDATILSLRLYFLLRDTEAICLEFTQSSDLPLPLPGGEQSLWHYFFSASFSPYPLDTPSARAMVTYSFSHASTVASQVTISSDFLSVVPQMSPASTSMAGMVGGRYPLRSLRHIVNWILHYSQLVHSPLTRLYSLPRLLCWCRALLFCFLQRSSYSPEFKSHLPYLCFVPLDPPPG